MKDSLPLLIYLHGFNSSPKALKAQLIEDYISRHGLQVEFARPQLPDLPDQAINSIEQLLEENSHRRCSLVGSSLGGYYASYFSQRFRVKSVLINPAVRPFELMEHYLGHNTNPYSLNEYELTRAHMQTLKLLFIEAFENPGQFLVLLQTGDETLDALEASQRFFRSACMIEPGGDHRFQGLERYLPRIFSWLELE